MPSAITHAIVGACAGGAVSGFGSPKRILIFSVLAAILPDGDVLGFFLDIPEQHLLGHRGFTHSIIFSLLAAACFLPLLLFRSFWRAWGLYYLYFFLVLQTHGLLDAFTNGGEGVAFFSPFSNQRIFFDFTPIPVSPVNPLVFFDGRAAFILQDELWLVWAPALGAALLLRLLLLACRRHLPLPPKPTGREIRRND